MGIDHTTSGFSALENQRTACSVPPGMGIYATRFRCDAEVVLASPAHGLIRKHDLVSPSFIDAFRILPCQRTVALGNWIFSWVGHPLVLEGYRFIVAFCNRWKSGLECFKASIQRFFVSLQQICLLRTCWFSSLVFCNQAVGFQFIVPLFEDFERCV